MTSAPLLLPALALVAWTLVMLLWTAGTRFPAMGRAGIDLSKATPGGRGQDLDPVLPPLVSWKSHNHTHLHEQPTLFYAVVGALAIMGAASPMNVVLAWTYVGLRVAHSLWQATVNRLPVRFALFALASLTLIALTVSALTTALSG